MWGLQYALTFKFIIFQDVAMALEREKEEFLVDSRIPN